ncbi:MAG TPA: extracellular solute-binding protein [Epulopiscium sp.]|nr:extracellular solute-binding protein [Candidatus Epulonipiscium sp.]
MKKKRLAIITLLMLMSIIFVGCGKAGEKTEEKVDSQTENPEVENGIVTLRLWGGEADQAILADMVESFKVEYAGEAQFDITIEPQSESTARDNLLGDVQNGADVFTFADDQLLTMVAAGALVKVDNTDQVKNANIEGAVSAVTVRDSLYAYPMTADNGYFMYYDKSIFTDEDVKSLEKMLDKAAQANKKIAMDWTSGWYLYSFFGNESMNLSLNDDGITMTCDWNTTQGEIKGVEIANSMLNIAKNSGFTNMNNEDFINGVKAGRVAAGVSGVWDATAIKAAWGNNFGAVKLPTYKVAEKDVQMASFSGYKMVGVNAYSDHPEWGLRLADWITNEQNQKLRFTQREQGPSNKNAASSDEVKNALAIQAVLAQSEFATLQRVGNSYWGPMQTLGETLAAGNPKGTNLQELMDSIVAEITASAVK